MSRHAITRLGPVWLVLLAGLVASQALAAPPALGPMSLPAPDPAAESPVGPDANGLLPPGSGVAPSGGHGVPGDSFDVIWGDWVCFERWTFGCLQWHCVHPGDECCVFVPRPDGGEDGSHGGDKQAELGF
jgi:hypothetical protein